MLTKYMRSSQSDSASMKHLTYIPSFTPFPFKTHIADADLTLSHWQNNY